VATGRDRREDGSVAERWDAWTRSEIMAARGYPAESSPTLAISVGRSGMTTDDKP
jgi:hypothetical protein